MTMLISALIVFHLVAGGVSAYVGFLSPTSEFVDPFGKCLMAFFALFNLVMVIFNASRIF